MALCNKITQKTYTLEVFTVLGTDKKAVAITRRGKILQTFMNQFDFIKFADNSVQWEKSFGATCWKLTADYAGLPDGKYYSGALAYSAFSNPICDMYRVKG